MIASEKEAWEKEMRAKDKIIEKKNSIIGELEKGKIVGINKIVYDINIKLLG